MKRSARGRDGDGAVSSGLTCGDVGTAAGEWGDVGKATGMVESAASTGDGGAGGGSGGGGRYPLFGAPHIAHFIAVFALMNVHMVHADDDVDVDDGVDVYEAEIGERADDD